MVEKSSVFFRRSGGNEFEFESAQSTFASDNGYKQQY